MPAKIPVKVLVQQRSVREALSGLLGLLFGAALLALANHEASATLAPTPAPAPAPVLAPAPPNSPPSAPFDAPTPVASYQLKASLDASKHRITGTGTLRFTNTAQTATSELYFHLYLNAFKNTKSLFQRSEFRGARSNRKATVPGSIDVEKVVAVEMGNQDLWPSAEHHSPGDPDDETDIRVSLPRALAAGETLTLQLAWKSQLPELTERSGFAGDFNMVAQWFPKLARLEPNGTWAHFPFHPNSEFYADFGDYEVTLDVPSDEVVGASGEQIRKEDHAGRTALTFRALGVHDFAWTAWPRFLTRDEVMSGVQVRLLYPVAAESLVARELDAVRFALPHFEQLYGRYPYSTLTLVHPPADAEGAGGMEYPTLITTGGAASHNLFARGIELVTVHELGHQWFYGLVASNESASPFLDEGLNSYAEAEAMHSRWGNVSGGKLWDLELSAAAVTRAQAAAAQFDDAVGNAAALFSDFSSIGSLVYARTATIMQTLAGVYGKAQLQAALGAYTRRYRFQHPSAEDFIEQVATVLGPEAERALRALIFERGFLDYTVSEVNSAPASESGKDPWLGDVLIRRHGTVSFPVDIVLFAADGSEHRQRWNGSAPWLRIDYSGTSELIGAVIDPELKLPIDSNLLNNSKMLKPKSAARSYERLVYGAQLLLG
ncbi:MAG TPA: M1 family metallopeptidase, partial [Polyangiaceae bacterium]|nr:M1 family metallopeptidase [Polyangiaceae bacterium]